MRTVSSLPAESTRSPAASVNSYLNVPNIISAAEIAGKRVLRLVDREMITTLVPFRFTDRRPGFWSCILGICDFAERIRFVDDFPMTVTGKLQKFRMRDLMAEVLKPKA